MYSTTTTCLFYESVASSEFSLSSKFSPTTALTIGSEGQWGFEKWTKVDP